MNIAVFGVGALGCLYGSFLAKNTNLVLIGRWREQIETLNANGLTVICPDGKKEIIPLRATDDVSEIPPADIALVLVKSYQTGPKSSQIARVLRPEGVAVSLQNGLGNGDIIAVTVGKNRVAQGITEQGAALSAPGLLRHAGSGTTFFEDRPDLLRLSELLNESGMEAKMVRNIESYQWGKLAVNAGINPLTALLETSNGYLLRERRALKIMIAVVKEVAATAKALQIKFPFEYPVEYVKSVCAATADNRSSMLQDVLRGAPTEVDAISGAVVRFANRLGIPAPLNEKLMQLMQAKSAGCRFSKEKIYAELLT